MGQRDLTTGAFTPQQGGSTDDFWIVKNSH